MVQNARIRSSSEIFETTQHGAQFVDHLPQTSLDLSQCGARSVQEATEHQQKRNPFLRSKKRGWRPFLPHHSAGSGSALVEMHSPKTLLWLKCTHRKLLAISVAISTVELETREMLSAHT